MPTPFQAFWLALSIRKYRKNLTIKQLSVFLHPCFLCFFKTAPLFGCSLKELVWITFHESLN